MPKPEVPGYDLLEPVGKGAGSLIYKGLDLDNQDLVAVKYVQASNKEEEKYFRHVEHEYQTVCNLHAPSNGRPVRGRFTCPRALVRSRRLVGRRKYRAFVMDFVPGADLRREQRYPLGQMLDFFLQLLETLDYLHSRGVVHADVKPENLIVSPTGEVTLVDFGLSCPLGSKASSVRGTREYMAPEQVDRGWLDARTDLYNAGASFYYLLTERQVNSVVRGGSEQGFFLPSSEMETVPITELNPDVPPGAARAIMQCIQSDPDSRPSSAAVLLHHLRPQAERFWQQQEAG